MSRLSALALAILVLAGCGQGTQGGASPPISPAGPASSSRQESPPPVALLKPCGALPQAGPASTQALVLGRLSGSMSWVVRDVTDIAHPVTVGSLGDKWPWANPPASVYDTTGGLSLEAKLVNPSGVVWADRGGSLFALAPNASGQRALLSVSSGNAVLAFAWSPIGDDWTYLVNTPEALEWHLVSGGTDRLLSATARIPATDGTTRMTPIMVAFSGDGRFLAMTDYIIGGPSGSGDTAKFQIRKSDGSLIATGATIVPASSAVSDLLWVGPSLYFRDDNGIEVWTQGGACSAFPGTQWIRPKLSPDGKQIVFYAQQANGLDHVFLVDLGAKNVKQISPAGGAEAWFLGSGYVWFLEQRLCGATEECGLSRATFTGNSYIVNSRTGVSSLSGIVRIADTWPRPGQPEFDNFWWMDGAAYH